MLRTPQDRATKAQLLLQFQTQQLARIRCYQQVDDKFLDTMTGECSSDDFYRFCVDSTTDQYTALTRDIEYTLESLIQLFGDDMYFVRHARRVQYLEQRRWSQCLKLYIIRLHSLRGASADGNDPRDDEARYNELCNEITSLLEMIQIDIDSIVDGYISS
ncbi:hypothetical protein H4R35_002695 [Dimargaris xerosporica]|nr:hypothetical protein H4R35_002695 [Dimargaris xerosporica]